MNSLSKKVLAQQRAPQRRRVVLCGEGDWGGRQTSLRANRLQADADGIFRTQM